VFTVVSVFTVIRAFTVMRTISVMRVSILVLVLTLTGCVYLKAVSRPLDYRLYEVERADNLLILLPGMGDSTEHYDKHRFPQTLQQLHSNWDVLVLDAHFGYYRDRVLIDAVKQDILPIIDRKTYKKIVVGGISMGGYGAMLLQYALAERVDGVILIAAYLGEKDLLEQATQQPISKWQATANQDREQQALAYWYRQNKSKSLLAFGTADQFAKNMTWLGEETQEGNKYQREGGHKWTTWKLLWQEMVQHPTFWQ